MRMTMEWNPPTYGLISSPERKDTFKVQIKDGIENFARSAKWTPDGTRFLAHCEDRSLQLFNPSLESESERIHPQTVFRQPAPILDFIWYPSASPLDPASFCLLASVRDCPVKLIDASDGRLRASYKIVDHRERFIAPHCMAFNLNATKIYCGFEESVEVFDVLRPGEGTRLYTSPSRKSKDGLKGIISSLAFSPDYSTGSDAFYAAGTLNPTHSNLALYCETQGDVPLMFVGGGLRAGITQLKFNPTRPHILYVAYRRRDIIYAWDLRSDVNMPFAKYVLPHSPKTNQKALFDIDITGTRLATGDQEGTISLFDLKSTEDQDQAESSEADTKNPDLQFSAHKDSIGSVAFHPFEPVLLSVSGSRHFDKVDVEKSGSESSEDDDTKIVMKQRSALQPTTTDSSVQTWKFNPIEVTVE